VTLTASGAKSPTLAAVRISSVYRVRHRRCELVPQKVQNIENIFMHHSGALDANAKVRDLVH
jgi:hypothetical protein